MSAGDPNDLLTSHEVAAILRCEIRKALRLLGDEIPSAFDGNRWLTRRRDVDAWLESRVETARNSKARTRGRRRLT